MRRLIVLCASAALLLCLSVQADWTRVKLPSGAQVCQDSATGVQFKPPFTTKDSVDKVCIALTSFIPWLGTAEATPISKQLNANPDGTRDTANPCLASDGSDCKAPAGTSIGWTQTCLDALLGAENSVLVGTPLDEPVENCATGSNLASATMTVVLASDGTTNCNATNLSITGSQPNRKLHNSATGAGSGTCRLKLTYMGSSVLAGSFPWTNTSSGGTDTTPPTLVTGIVGTGGTLQATATFDAQMDPDDGVTRSGIASYKIYSDNAYTGTSLTAATPGLTCDFTPQTIGAPVTGSPSATQGTGTSGAQWTINGGGFGVESADSYYGSSCPVSGTSVYLITQVTSLANVLTYNKAHSDIRNGLSTTAAHYDCVVMRIGTAYYLQRTYRTTDGGANASSAAVALAGAPPYYVRTSLVSNAGGCDYSTDGGAWVPVVSNEPITLNDSKIAVVGASATTTGSDSAAITAVFGSVAVQTAGRLSKTVTLTAGTHALKVGVVDVAGNETVGSASASVTVASGGSATKKWHPGNYIQAHAAHGSYCGTGCDAYRHGRYPVFMGDSNVKGTVLWVWWKYLESDAGNDFTSGFSWLHNEINYIKSTYPGKQVGVLIYFGPYGQGTGDAAQRTVYPNYFVNAGCPVDEMDGSGNSIVYKIGDPTCRGYAKRLLAAYGAEFDSEPALEFVRLDQETDYANGEAGTAKDTGWEDVAAAAAAAFPTTNIWVPVNWVGVDTAANKEAMLLYYKSIGVATGSADTQPPALSYACPSTSWPCVIRGLNASIGGTSHDNCGEVAVFQAVELSEQGYNSVTDPPGGLTSQQVVTSWNNDYCAQYGTWDLNDSEIGSSDTMYWNGAHGQKWAIDNFPLTHTTKPAGYP